MQRKVIVLLLLAAAFSCTKSGGNAGGSTSNSDQDTILVNIGNNIILPAYQALFTAVYSLDSAVTDFNGAPTSTRLSNVQALFKTAYIDWTAVSAYNYFGPAADAQPVLSSLNVFPASTTQIEANVSAGNTNVNTFSNTAAKGFPALDYLLFGNGSGTLTWYTTDSHAAGRMAYLAAVSADIKTETGAVLNAWGSYLTTFVNGTGNSVSSSLGLLINSMDQDVEITKNDRLGIPLGLIPVGTTSPVQPKEVEAYYSGISAQLALSQIKAVQNILLGNGRGLINYVAKANVSLSDTIKATIALDIQDLQAVSDPLSQSIQSNPGAAETAFAKTQRLVALLKTDMPSALGVLITYGDNDGD
jgi:predicted lipoprotein